MKISITEAYLKIPVKKAGEIKELRIFSEGKLIWEFRLPIDLSAGETYEEDFYGVLPVKAYQGQELELETEAPACFWDGIVQSEVWEETESPRPGIHFFPVSGWMNDPNGLYYQNGEYHLYFQYNPFHVEWDNMSWGHAVSTDLLHWKQLDSVMFPDEDGMMFSGCAVLNERELLGLPKDTPLFFYTATGSRTSWAADKKVTQKMAYSLDGGQTLIKVQKPVVDFIVEENRDPKIYWHEETAHYYMVLYLTGNEFAVFISEDLKNWEMTQRFAAGKCNECPDLREIPCEDGGKKWMFWSADGFYSICQFDGRQITEMGEIKNAYLTALPYAAQTYVGVPEDRVITIPWLRMKNQGQNFTGYQGLPRELKLVKAGTEDVLTQRPVEEYFRQREEIADGTRLASPAAVTAELLVSEEESVSVELAGLLCSYDRKNGVCVIGEQTLTFSGNPSGISILLDGAVVEVSDLEYRETGILLLEEKRDIGMVKKLQGEKASVRFFVNR